ncbi:MAG: DUF1549 and DUF1553 domain-containing protein [Fuerstiella sp.]|nr:DUF1549 and DUF1553 domain-containing protein [Fuerstiella sp.]
MQHDGLNVRFLLAGVAVAFAVNGGTNQAGEEDAGSTLPQEPVIVGSPDRIEVSPEEFRLLGPREKLQLIITGYYADGSVQDLTRTAMFSVNDANISVSEAGVVLPVSDGMASVTVAAGDLTAEARIEVVGQQESHPVSFQYGTLVALSKQGCNSGACHGSPSGKGGFRLSLRAFDAELDQYTLLREEFGRRTDALDPENSLLLLKPLMKVTHGGGLKLNEHDPAYSILRDWIAGGCQTDPEDAPVCVGIRVTPGENRVLIRPAHTQQMCVMAEFSDGTVRDVTELAVYSTSDTEVAQVTRGGFVIGKDRGEAAVIVRYLEFIESTILTFVKDIDGYEWQTQPVNNYVDTLTHAKLQKLRYLPSDLCTDEEFLRRVYLDLVGSLPSIEEAQQFLSDSSADSREKLVNRLLDRPEYGKFWALKWGDILRLTKGQVGDDGVHKYHRWIERAVSSNMPYDEFARELLTASGSTLENPAANFFRTTKDMNDCVETVSQIFLGARLQCAKCHNHPFERWTQDNYYGMGAFFNRVQRKKTRRPDEVFVWSAPTGDVTQPRTGQTMQPWVPVVGNVKQLSEIDRRQSFADWLTTADNPFFAKIEVNRIWSHLLGRGIVDPVDDFRESNPPSNGPLLDALAQDFVEHGFDRKHVIRRIVNSRTYQMSHRPNDFNRDDSKYFSHYWPRLLTAEQMLDAICHVTGIEETFESLPPGMKATQLPAPDLVNHEFLKVFGQPERQTACECERTTESNLGMAIQFLNGPLIHNKVRDGSNRFRSLVSSGKSDEEIITELNLAALARVPTGEEMAAEIGHVASKKIQLEEENVRLQAEIELTGQTLEELKKTLRDQVFDIRLLTVPEAIRDDVRVAVTTAEQERSPVQIYLVEKLGALREITDEQLLKELPEEQQKQLTESEAGFAKLQDSVMSPENIRLVALEDICWVLLNRNEFLFNH